MSVVVRSAAIKDLGSLVTLNQVVQELHVESEPDWFKDNINFSEVEVFFGNLIVSESTFLLIAEINDSPVGYIWFEVQERLATPFTKARRRIYIHHVVVSADSRKLGVGSSLLRAAESEAQARGITQLALDTWVFNRDAQGFFRAADFEPFNVVMRKKLGAST